MHTRAHQPIIRITVLGPVMLTLKICPNARHDVESCLDWIGRKQFGEVVRLGRYPDFVEAREDLVNRVVIHVSVPIELDRQVGLVPGGFVERKELVFIVGEIMGVEGSWVPLEVKQPLDFFFSFLGSYVEVVVDDHPMSW